MNDLLHGDRPLSHQYGAALVDLDGVVYRGSSVVSGADTALVTARRAGMHITFITNNASRTASQVAARLMAMGVLAGQSEIVTSAHAAARLIARKATPGARVLVIGAAGLLESVGAAGFRIVDSADDHPDFVALGFSESVGWRQLAEATIAIQNGASFVATNADGSIPTERGLVPGNGALVSVISTAIGAQPELAGKPRKEFYEAAMGEVPAEQFLAIGDRLDTDIAGARGAEIASLHVLTGVHQVLDQLSAIPRERPDYIGFSLAALNQSYPEVTRDVSGGWNCRGVSARVQDGFLELSGTSVEPVDIVRVACAAAWSAADRGDAIEAHLAAELVERSVDSQRREPLV